VEVLVATEDSSGVQRLRRAQVGASRRSASRAIAFLVLALTAAVAAAVVFTRYMDESFQSTKVPVRNVVVAAVDLQLGTILAPDMLSIVAWPQASVPAGTFEDALKLKDRVVTTRTMKGEPVLESRLANSEAGNGLAAVLTPGTLAVAVRVNDVVGVAGFVHPGDSVDVIVTMRPKENSDAPHMSKIILQNIKVLAVGKQLDRNDKTARTPLPATVATLMVTPEEAERLALASSRGEILLALRSSLDQEMSETTGVVPQILLTGSGASLPVRTRPATTANAKGTAVVPPPEGEVVEILRGDMFEKRRFEEKKEKK
jgi:pilus assembly protein CpaB